MWFDLNKIDMKKKKILRSQRKKKIIHDWTKYKWFGWWLRQLFNIKFDGICLVKIDLIRCGQIKFKMNCMCYMKESHLLITAQHSSYSYRIGPIYFPPKEKKKKEHKIEYNEHQNSSLGWIAARITRGKKMSFINKKKKKNQENKKKIIINIIINVFNFRKVFTNGFHFKSPNSAWQSHFIRSRNLDS